jgi:predicted short-subunit dehydrogenase-like oxidoreductase (DUF2520 family)
VVGEEVLVIGRGRLGTALARALGARTTPGRRIAKVAWPEARVIVIAVPDAEIERVAIAIAPRLAPRAVVLHVAGSRDPSALAACARRGASTGVMHPLVSFASRAHPPPLTGSTFVVDGDRRAIRAGSDIARAVSARAIRAPLHGAPYHAVAALVANGSAALASLAVEVLLALGASRRPAERAVGALLASVAANVAEVGVPGALTGPIARGDALTVSRHREALAGIHPGARAAYDAIAPAVLAVARAGGLDAASARRVARALTERRRSK